MISRISITFCAVLLAGCASAPTITDSTTKRITSASVPHFGSPQTTGTPDAELQSECKTIHGRMHIRLMQMRSYKKRTPSSIVSKALHQTIAPIIGGSIFGANPEQDHQRDLKELRGYNAQLAALGCPTIDIDKELKKK